MYKKSLRIQLCDLKVLFKKMQKSLINPETIRDNIQDLFSLGNQGDTQSCPHPSAPAEVQAEQGCQSGPSLTLLPI